MYIVVWLDLKPLSEINCTKITPMKATLVRPKKFSRRIWLNSATKSCGYDPSNG